VHAFQKGNQTCPLCRSTDTKYKSTLFSRNFHECKNCFLIFVDPAQHLKKEEERARYELHENSIENKGYCTFLNRLAEPFSSVLEKGSVGLDYGCGPGPTLSKLLSQKGHTMFDYDPLFFPDKQHLERQYDFITSTEVFEHFHDPAREIPYILSLIRPGGWLAVMTEMIPPDIEFEKWHYICEPSHVCFYHDRTMHWIAEKNNLSIYVPHKNVRIFRK
jgi:SAM-dependent methyltransferase